jgi:hypothetical protein
MPGQVLGGKAVFSAQQHRKEAFIAYKIGGEY